MSALQPESRARTSSPRYEDWLQCGSCYRHAPFLVNHQCSHCYGRVTGVMVVDTNLGYACYWTGIA